MTVDPDRTPHRPIGRLSLGRYIALACHLEVAADKPGNVTPRASFVHTKLLDFLVSGEVISQTMECAAELSVGALVFDAVEATQAWVGQNTNLGLILLLAPLAKAGAQVARGIERPRVTPAAVREVLTRLTAEDARLVFAAIRRAAPGGLGRSEQLDVADEPPADLLAAMQVAASRDLIAAQYISDFSTIFQEVLPSICAGVAAGWELSTAIVVTQLRMMARHSDSLIARKAGDAVAAEAARRAAAVLEHLPPDRPAFREALQALDGWLRDDGNRRNPGTTADLIGGALFVGLFNGELVPPWH